MYGFLKPLISKDSSGNTIESDLGFRNPEVRKGRLERFIQNGLWNGVRLGFFFLFSSILSCCMGLFVVLILDDCVIPVTLLIGVDCEIFFMIFSSFVEGLCVVDFVETCVVVSVSSALDAKVSLIFVNLFVPKSSLLSAIIWIGFMIVVLEM